MARRNRRAVGVAAIPFPRVNAFLRLIEYARPHRARLASAVAAMIVYGAASAYLAYLIKPILNETLPNGRDIGFIVAAILIAYLIKGIGAYVSDYWMADAGQRVVRDLRNVLFRHILGQSAAFFSTNATGRLIS